MGTVLPPSQGTAWNHKSSLPNAWLGLILKGVSSLSPNKNRKRVARLSLLGSWCSEAGQAWWPSVTEEQGSVERKTVKKENRRPEHRPLLSCWTRAPHIEQSPSKGNWRKNIPGLKGEVREAARPQKSMQTFLKKEGVFAQPLEQNTILGGL